MTDDNSNVTALQPRQQRFHNPRELLGAVSNMDPREVVVIAYTDPGGLQAFHVNASGGSTVERANLIMDLAKSGLLQQILAGRL